MIYSVYGYGNRTVDLGVVKHQHCCTCERERPFKIVLNYRYFHCNWIFSWVSQKQYYLACDICRRGTELDTQEVEKSLTQNPIPLIRRSGWLSLGTLVALGVIGSIIGGMGDRPTTVKTPYTEQTTPGRSSSPSVFPNGFSSLELSED